MNVREYTPFDLSWLLELHKTSAYEYEMPDLSSPSFVVKKVLISEDGSISMGAFLRKTTEAFLICDPSWRTPRWRLEGLRCLHDVVQRDAEAKGIESVHCWIPPEIEARFRNRLEDFGWRKERPWPVYSRNVVRGS